jgi:glycosyltransferase involved in cell wall biosynthesis
MGHDLIWSSVSWNNRREEDSIDGIRIIREQSNIIAHLMVPMILRFISPDVIVDDMGHAVPWGSENFTKAPGTVMFYHLHRRSLPGQVSLPLRFLISGTEAAYPLIYRRWTFVTDSNQASTDLKNLGIGSDRIFEIPLGVDERWHLNNQKTEFPSLVYFGGMRDYKRPWESLYVLRDVLKHYKNSMLYVIGSGPAETRVQETATKLKISDSVRMMGRVSDEALRQIVSSCWINIHSSVTEGFGLSILEASAAGTPTIAYNVPGVSETVVNYRNGILVPNGDRHLLSEAAFRILNSYPGTWVSSSREIAQTFTWNRTAEMWEKHLQDVAYGKK